MGEVVSRYVVHERHPRLIDSFTIEDYRLLNCTDAKDTIVGVKVMKRADDVCPSPSMMGPRCRLVFKFDFPTKMSCPYKFDHGERLVCSFGFK